MNYSDYISINATIRFGKLLAIYISAVTICKQIVVPIHPIRRRQDSRLATFKKQEF